MSVVLMVVDQNNNVHEVLVTQMWRLGHVRSEHQVNDISIAVDSVPPSALQTGPPWAWTMLGDSIRRTGI